MPSHAQAVLAIIERERRKASAAARFHNTELERVRPPTPGTRQSSAARLAFSSSMTATGVGSMPRRTAR
jgi:hypothetical protein